MSGTYDLTDRHPGLPKAAPFLIYVEILSCDDPTSISLPSRPITSSSSKSSTRCRNALDVCRPLLFRSYNLNINQ
ncbi:unnamed protein product [Trichobilharzia regenti]|nr:unnamed protein product [Trichobilharzia regenti]